MRKSTKWLSILSIISFGIGVFYVLQARTLAFFNPLGIWGIERQYFFALLFLFVGLVMIMVVLIRFMRSRSILGGLIFTTLFTAALFFFVGKFVTWGPFMGVQTASATGTARYSFNIGANVTINLAQIGLFAIWLLFVAILMFFQIRPVARIQRALEAISNGDSCQRIKIGKSRQFRKIEEQLTTISTTICDYQLKKAQRAKARKEALAKKAKQR